MNRTIGLLVSRAWMSLCAFATFVVIGQSLTPADFGIFALASSISLLPHGLVGSGFYERTMSRSGDVREYQTSFWCTALMGILGCAATLLVAGALVLLLEDQRVAALLATLSLAILFWGFSAIHEADLLRQGKGGRVAAVLVLAETVGFASLLAGLFAGLGVGSLVIGRCTNAAVTLIGYSLASRTPKLGLDRGRARQLLSYSADMMMNRSLHWVDGYGGDILTAGVLSTSGLGLYRMGMRLFGAVGGVILTAPSAALIATAGNAADVSLARISVVTSRYIRLHAIFAFPVLAVLAATASPIVAIVLKPEWATAAHVTALACLQAPSWVVGGATSAVLLARGQSRTLLYVNVTYAVVGMLAILLGFIGGPEGIAAAKSLLAALFTFSVMLLVGTLDRRHAWPTLYVVAIALVASVLCAATIGVLLEMMHEAVWLPLRLVQLALTALAGLAVYVVALWVLAPGSFALTRSLVLLLLGLRGGASACRRRPA